MMRLLEPLQRFAHITVVTQVGSQCVVMGFGAKLIAKGLAPSWVSRGVEHHNGSQWSSRAVLDHNGEGSQHGVAMGLTTLIDHNGEGSQIESPIYKMVVCPHAERVPGPPGQREGAGAL
jgi:hypothetical protein